MKLSIVIPVYRVEGTLNRCVESVLGQSFSDFELILVDDGSPDRCPQMCDSWAAKDQRVRVIHKPNGGLSDARNAGLDITQGKYVTFVDSDDYIAPDTFAPIMKRLQQREDIDLIEYPVDIFFDSPRRRELRFPEEKEYTDMEEYWYEGRAYEHTYACNKVYRKTLFGGVRFPKGVVFEDVHTLPKLLERAKLVCTINQGLYHYSSNPSGITSTANGQALAMLLAPHVSIISKTKRRDAAFYRYYMHVVNIQMDVYELTGTDPQLPQMHVSTETIDGLPKLKAIMLNALGIKRLCKLNKAIHKVWRNHS